MSWNYRLVDYGSHLALHEVYYGPDGKVEGGTASPRAITGDTAEEIAEDLELMLEDIRKHPPLREQDMPQ